MIRLIRISSLAALAAVLGLAQTAAPPLEFDVASVKPVNHPVPPHAVSLNINHGRVTFDAAALRQIIGLSYGVQRIRVKGGPSWIENELYDIVAKTESPDATKEQVMAMMQALLADRFKLVVHHETRELPVYSLVIAKNGPKFKEAADDETPSANFGIGQWTVRKRNLVLLVNSLANMLDNPVQDKTGLTKLYDYGLDLTPQRGQLSGSTDAIDSSPSIFAALEDQLGLKLEAKRGPAEVLVIDHAEHATEN